MPSPRAKTRIRWPSAAPLACASSPHPGFSVFTSGKAVAMTPSRLWHTAGRLKCSLTPIRPGDEVCRSPLLRARTEGPPQSNEEWGAGHLAPPGTEQRATYHLSEAPGDMSSACRINCRRCAHTNPLRPSAAQMKSSPHLQSL